MPFETTPLAPIERPEPIRLSQQAAWIRSQPFSRDHAWSQIGQLRPGTLRGGPTLAQFDILDNPRQYAIYASPPRITERAQVAREFGRFGTVTLSAIDPFMTTQSIAEGIGVSRQQAQGVADAAKTFLGERDIDPFGQGAAGVPARLFDYATGWLGALYDQATGKPITAPMPTGETALQYDFQEDPGYWALVTAENASDDFLAGVARQVAGQYVSGDNRYLAEQLLAQFKADRDRMLGISSGDRRVDYQAKLAFTADFITQNTGGPAPRARTRSPFAGASLSQRYSSAAGSAALMQLPSAIVGAIPFVGADLRDQLYRHPEIIEEAWSKLSGEERQKYWGEAGFQMLLGDAAVWLPLLGGAGAVQSVVSAPGRTGLLWQTARGAFKAYEFTRNVTVAGMATGLGVATTNWALAAAVPGYAETLGQRIDYARPVSSSAVAGLVNQIGFFASGTFGGHLLARGTLRGAGAVAGKVGLRPGAQELSYFKNVFGGSAVTRELANAGLPDPGILELSVRRSFLSELQNWLRADDIARVEAFVKGNPTFIRQLDEITDQAARAEAANAWLMRGLELSGVEVEGIVKAMLQARRPRPLFSGAAQRVHDTAVKLARYVDDEMARVHAEEYGDKWLMSLAGDTTPAALQKYAHDTFARLGGDPARLGRHNAEGWSQIIRTLHNYEYDRLNGLLRASAEGAEESSKVMLVQARHLFANDVDDYLDLLRGDDVALAQATAENLIRTTREADAWFAREWKPDAGVARTPGRVPPGAMADWLDEIRPALPHRRINADPDASTAGLPLNVFQAEIEKGGLWTLAFKPTDDAGNLVSYVRRRNGNVFRSPWIEYPMGNAEAIELGNRGILLSKADGITRGFRTWKIIEYQKALLFRRLSARLAVTPEQVEVLHARLMMAARQGAVQPQTLGAVARGKSPVALAPLVREKLDKVIEDTFGPGPYLNRLTNEPIDMYDEIAKAFRQSFRLNLTAGITSFIKANLGEAGSFTSWFSDQVYVAWRFNWSPLFKGGELWESAQLNAMRGVRGITPDVEALYVRAGIGNDYGPLAAEMSYDDMIRSMTGQRAVDVTDSSGRFAASMGFYARSLPDDFTGKANAAFAQESAARGATDALPPLADDELGLLRQLKETLAEKPKEPTGLFHGSPTVGLKSASANPATRQYDNATSQFGAFVTPVRAEAERYAGEGGMVYEALAAPQNPYKMTRKEFNYFQAIEKDADGVTLDADRWAARSEELKTEAAALRQKLEAEGYDGITVPGNRGNPPEVASFRDVALLDPELDALVGGNGVAAGLESRARAILAKLEDLQATKLDEGPTIAWADALPRQQAEFRVRLEQDGWLPIRAKIQSLYDEGAQDATNKAQELNRIAGGRRGGSAESGGAMLPEPPRIPALGDDVDWDTPVGAAAKVDGDWRKVYATVGRDPARGGKIDRYNGEGQTTYILRDEAGYPAGELRLRVEAPKADPVVDADGTLRLSTKGSWAEAGIGTRKGEAGFEGTVDVLLVETRPDARRKGAATALYDRAIRDGFDLVGQAGRFLTGQGKAFRVGYLAKRGYGEDLWAKTRLDDTIDVRAIDELYDEWQRTPGAAEKLEDVAGTAEAFAQMAAVRGKSPGWKETFIHPTEWKLRQATKLQIKLARDEFPALLRMSGNGDVIRIFEGLGLPESSWLDWLIEDRVLLQRWVDNRLPEDWNKLMAHAGGPDPRGLFDEMYGSEEWASLQALIGANFKATGQEAFGVHFFSPYRSVLERSINHPLLGLYPASWSIKVAREWAKFLFDNQTLGINLGMAPAQAIAQLVHAQQASFAQMTGEEWDAYLGHEGPLGSPVFILNLLMPGDWSAAGIFNLSRPVRDYSRALLAGDDLPDAGQTFWRAATDYGIVRDMRLFFESAGQAGDLLRGPIEEEDPLRARRWYSVAAGVTPDYAPPR